MMESRLRRLALALLEAGAEAEPAVREQLQHALSGLGAADPEELLQCCGEHLRHHDKLPAAQRALILRSMGAVVRSHLPELGKAAAADAIALAGHEMARARDPEWEWQEAAGALLVELGRAFLGRVMEELLRQFPPGMLPQRGVVRAFADLAGANVFGMVPFLSSILGTLLPLLGTARADSMKCTLCYALQRFSESIQEYVAGKEQAPDPTVRGDAFAPELGAAFDLLGLQWVQSRDAKVRLAAVAALGPMSSLISPEKLQEQLPKLLPTVLGLYKKHPEPFPISKSLCQLLESWVARGGRGVEAQLEPLLPALLGQICAPADPTVPTSSKNHTELLRCFSVLAPYPCPVSQPHVPALCPRQGTLWRSPGRHPRAPRAPRALAAPQVLSWAQQQGERLRAQAAALAAEREETEQLLDWITAAEEALGLRDQEPLPEEAEQLEELSAQHAVFMEELNRKQPDVEKVTKSCKRKLAVDLGPPATRRLATRRRSSGKAQGTAAVPLGGLEPQTPLMAQLLHRWQQLWLLALDRQYRLETALQRLRELEEFAHFDFGVWRKRYMQWISQMKSRVLDVFRGIDRDQDGRISQREFIEGVLASKFPTNVLEMNAVATIFDMNGDGFIDYYEFVSALHPNRDPLRRSADADQIQDEVNRQVAQCNCAKRFQVEQISANRYRFGESQQLRMVRILRSTLMVRVGGGWIALDEFLVKNDPCRVKGRTNLKINEKYLSSDVFGAAARCAGNQSAASSKVLSPSRSNSSLSLYSSASAPSSPLARKSVLRRTRSGDRCPRSRGSGLPDGAELQFSAAEDSLAVAPPEPPEGSPPERCSPCR
ncbi:maestro heat-like repeat-containing protein family member 1 [Motacilla alba alba]|uniref:maestro heat-like repeat-containing protein family member 1 n=1 Tax=Motacilla alba alba TaxID=1094192 RepID=UPI0018D4F565|nr:maestro heat-like repeat-containing protein family member 1 [Motacilla alba alba]